VAGFISENLAGLDRNLQQEKLAGSKARARLPRCWRWWSAAPGARSRILEDEGGATVSVEQVSSLLPHPVARDDRLSGRAARAAARAGRMLLRFVEGRSVSLVTCAFLA
jgi:hypothetical protein